MEDVEFNSQRSSYDSTESATHLASNRNKQADDKVEANRAGGNSNTAADDILSNINRTYKQSKADQIFRLLKDQENLNQRFENCELKEENQNSESDSDSDALSDTSVKITEKKLEQKLSLYKQKGGRSKTSMGFYNDVDNDEDLNITTKDNFKMEPERVMDTRFNRPKSSYVRRRGMYRRKDENAENSVDLDEDVVLDTTVQRISKSARPRSRLGNRNAEGCKRKIALAESNMNDLADGPVLPTREELIIGASTDYDKFANTRPSRLQRERSKVKGFCDEPRKSPEAMNVSPCNSIEIKEDITEIQTIRRKTPTPISSNFSPSRGNAELYSRGNTITDSFTRGNSMNSPEPKIAPAPIPPSRPKNPEPIESRPIGRPRTRNRLQRRLMQQQHLMPGQSHVSRPTSESVILARQRTERDLAAKAAQASNRPKSEKIPVNISGNKNVLSINHSPMQGPSTSVTKKSGVSQSSHIASSGFRGYDPNSRRPITSNKRDIGADLSMPRPTNNVVLGSRRPLALMKLPPLDTAVAKKAERGLALAARETCV